MNAWAALSAAMQKSCSSARHALDNIFPGNDLHHGCRRQMALIAYFSSFGSETLQALQKLSLGGRLQANAFGFLRSMNG
jgi:hypothetical protein